MEYHRVPFWALFLFNIYLIDLSYILVKTLTRDKVLGWLYGMVCYLTKVKSSPNLSIFKDGVASWIPEICKCRQIITTCKCHICRD